MPTSEVPNMRKIQVVNKRGKDEEPASAFTVQTVRYRECLKNHAAAVGGYAVDGCREFMASSEEGTNGALICDACGCHRSFHRMEVETEEVCESRSSSPSNGR